MRNALIPITVRTLETLIAILLKHAREDCSSILNSFIQKCGLLDQRPMQLDAFVTFVVVSKQMFCFMYKMY